MKDKKEFFSLEKIVFEGRDRLSRNLVFIDGITRAGKFWLAEAMQHLKNTEHTQYSTISETIIYMNLLGLISDETAMALLRFEIDDRVYETAIGRNINLRIADSSSVCRSPKLSMYLKRINAQNPHKLSLNHIPKSDKFFVFIFHELLTNARLVFKAFHKAKIIRVERNPIDLAYAWYIKKMYRINARTRSIRIPGKAGLLQWWAYEWPYEYVNMSPMDRAIKGVISMSDKARNSFNKLCPNIKKQVLFTSYENLATRPEEEIKRITTFLKTKQLRSMKAYLKGDVFQKRNKEKINKLRLKKIAQIKAKASKKMFSLIMDNAEKYSEKGLDI